MHQSEFFAYDIARDIAHMENGPYSAKDFRPTGATVAIDNGTDPEVAMQIGRWKTRSVFFSHYVHSTPPADYSQKLFDRV